MQMWAALGLTRTLTRDHGFGMFGIALRTMGTLASERRP
jgi:hypothetical protein